MNRVLFGEEVLEALFSYSGMTFDELSEYFAYYPTRMDRHMTLVNCLRALCDAGLIKVDGIKSDGIREFISYCEYPGAFSEFHNTGAGPGSNKFRSSDEWRKIRGALMEGLQYTSYFRMVCLPVFGKPNEDLASVSADVFVVMPFGPSMMPVYSTLCETVRDLGLTIKRADEFSSSNPIVSDIWSAIWGAKIVIADCTGRNPNVFYEIGIAHAVGKPVVLMAQDSADIPFDVHHIRYLLYRLDDAGLDRLTTRLEETLRNCLQLDEIEQRQRLNRLRRDSAAESNPS